MWITFYDADSFVDFEIICFEKKYRLFNPSLLIHSLFGGLTDSD